MSYGSTDTIITREGADPETFGFEDDEDTTDGQTAQEKLEQHIDELRGQASSQVEEFCGRVFRVVENQVDVLEGTGRKTITTRNYPVQTIHEIREGTLVIDPSNYQVVATRGRPDRNSGRIERTDRRRWSPGRDITIEYDWGYPDTPGVVDRVVEDMVVEVLEKSAVDRASSAKSSESMDGYNVSWDNSDVGDYLTLTESMKERLRPLKRQGVA